MKFHGWLILFFSFMVIIACDGPEVKKNRFLLKGNVRMQENDYPGAREFYDEALKIDGEFPDAYYNRGITYQITGSYQRAIEDFTKAISFRDGYLDAYYHRGLAYFDNGEYYKSLEDAGYLIQHEGKEQGYFLEGLCHEALGNNGEALDAFSNALKITPDNAGLYVNRATIYYYLEEIDSALADLKVAEELDASESNIYNLRSMIAFDQGDPQAAFDWVERAIALNSSQSYFYNNRGLYQLYLGKLEEGLEDINLSLKQNSRNLYALRNKGIYYVMKEEKDLALNYLEDVIGKDPDLSLTREYLEKATMLD